MPNKAVDSDALLARCAHYKCAGYSWRSAVEVSIEKDEKIAMQWLKKQT